MIVLFPMTQKYKLRETETEMHSKSLRNDGDIYTTKLLARFVLIMYNIFI